MATSGNRSPSPMSTRPNLSGTGSNSRTPEANSTMRRSYSGNPFAKPSVLSNPRVFPPPVAPANSPASDLGGRNSISKETGCFSRVFDEKENDKDQNSKPAKVRSPAIVKGTKNFMTPTISAASKINASPKKKVLGERNEPVRTSISFSDGYSPFGSLNNSDLKEDVDSKEDSKDSTITKVESSESQKMSESYSSVKPVESDMGLNQNNNKAEDSNSSAIRKSKKVSFFDSPLPLSSQSFSESFFDMNPLESDLTNSGNGGKIKPLGSAISPIIAPLDADPSRPYDPKTNYLSPRPQFLHYKPNPRIEVYLQKEKGIEGDSREQGKRLEESFVSESFSDTEVTSEEIESESSNKESEDDSSTEAVNEEVEPLVSEPKPNSLPFTTHVDKETVEEKRVLKPRFFTRSRSAALILILLIGCLSVSVNESPPVLDFSVYKDLSISKFYDLSEIVELSKASFDGFARNLKQWSANSVVYLIKLIGSLDEVEKLGPVQFSNLTSLLEDPFIDGYLKLNHIKEEIHEQEGEVEEELSEEDFENGAADEEADDSEEALGVDIEEEDLALVTEVVESEESEEALGVDIEEEDLALVTEVVESDSSELVLDQEPSDIPSLPSHDPEFRPDVGEILEIKPEIADAGEVQGAKIESATAEANPKSFLEMSTPLGDVSTSVSVNGSENTFSVHHMQTVSLLASALVAATAIAVVYLKHRRITTTPSDAVDPCLTQKLRTSTPQSHIWTADVDIVGESCPSEMSSFQNSMSYSKKGPLRGENEIQSQETKQRKVPKRRESLASSSDYSMGSPSYGSFTTYEKIPIKHRSGEEEIVTPVRRSSRFKNQVTSP
ncbi:hypothetical protein RHSIM_Rhsim05G0093300 [Rhododendron simsii]|uniref:Transmembrane protein n=1 Tax=Rhododendron simsii TaxID=118357 RepID=A0A834GWW4_RHOSS|nr:hypothetical protein RHSIM_Rhsim05G0093300 [Rhododendron simsii]